MWGWLPAAPLLSLAVLWRDSRPSLASTEDGGYGFGHPKEQRVGKDLAGDKDAHRRPATVHGIENSVQGIVQGDECYIKA